MVMSKYSNMERIERDLYPTPKKAVKYLVRHLIMTGNHHELTRFVEPCANNGSLVKLIKEVAREEGVPFEPYCIYMSDVYPDPTPDDTDTIHAHEAGGSPARGYFDWHKRLYLIDKEYDYTFITNPPWLNTSNSEYMLNNIIFNTARNAPTWLLLNSTYAWNQKSRPYMSICTDVVPVGRLKWIEDSDSVGKEDCAWFRFHGDIPVHQSSNITEYPQKTSRLWPRIKV